MDVNPYQTPEPLTNDRESRERSTSAIGMSLALFAITIAALSNNVIGWFGIMASPFWLPVCCYFVPFRVTRVYVVISGACLLLTLPLAVLASIIAFPDGFVFCFGLGAFLMLIASSLGALISYSRKSGAS